MVRVNTVKGLLKIISWIGLTHLWIYFWTKGAITFINFYGETDIGHTFWFAYILVFMTWLLCASIVIGRK